MSIIEGEEHRGYRAHWMNGVIEWWKTTKTKSLFINRQGKEIRKGSEIARVVTTATTLEEARKQLDRRLTRPKKEKEVHNPDQTRMFNEKAR
jgi:hypothetical protein